MSARSLVNAAWQHLIAESTPDGVEVTRKLLRLKFDWEMDPVERKRTEAYRRTLLAGGTRQVEQLAGRMMGGRPA
jgi:hypothetical protein